jgi:hypothetical protein
MDILRPKAHFDDGALATRSVTAQTYFTHDCTPHDTPANPVDGSGRRVRHATHNATVDGVDSLLFGLVSTEWVHLQDRYLKTLGLPSSRHEATRAIRSMILLGHEQCHAIWLLHNNHLHGSDPNNLTCYKHLHLLAQIHELYEAVPFMMTYDRPIFVFPFDCRKLQSASLLKAFYLHAKPIAELSIKQASQLGPLFQPITSYFRPTIPAHLFDIILGR